MKRAGAAYFDEQQEVMVGVTSASSVTARSASQTAPTSSQLRQAFDILVGEHPQSSHEQTRAVGVQYLARGLASCMSAQELSSFLREMQYIVVERSGLSASSSSSRADVRQAHHGTTSSHPGMLPPTAKTGSIPVPPSALRHEETREPPPPRAPIAGAPNSTRVPMPRRRGEMLLAPGEMALTSSGTSSAALNTEGAQRNGKIPEAEELQVDVNSDDDDDLSVALALAAWSKTGLAEVPGEEIEAATQAMDIDIADLQARAVVEDQEEFSSLDMAEGRSKQTRVSKKRPPLVDEQMQASAKKRPKPPVPLFSDAPSQTSGGTDGYGSPDGSASNGSNELPAGASLDQKNVTPQDRAEKLEAIITDLEENRVVRNGALDDHRMRIVMLQCLSSSLRSVDWLKVWDTMQIPPTSQSRALGVVLCCGCSGEQDAKIAAPQVITNLVKSHKVKLKDVEEALRDCATALDGGQLLSDGSVLSEEEVRHISARVMVAFFPQPAKAGWGWSRVGWSWASWWSFACRCLDEAVPSAAFKLLGLVLDSMQREACLPILEQDSWQDSSRILQLVDKLRALAAKSSDFEEEVDDARLDTLLSPMGVLLFPDRVVDNEHPASTTPDEEEMNIDSGKKTSLHGDVETGSPTKAVPEAEHVGTEASTGLDDSIMETEVEKTQSLELHVESAPASTERIESTVEAEKVKSLEPGASASEQPPTEKQHPDASSDAPPTEESAPLPQSSEGGPAAAVEKPPKEASPGKSGPDSVEASSERIIATKEAEGPNAIVPPSVDAPPAADQAASTPPSPGKTSASESSREVLSNGVGDSDGVVQAAGKEAQGEDVQQESAVVAREGALPENKGNDVAAAGASEAAPAAAEAGERGPSSQASANGCSSPAALGEKTSLRSEEASS